MNESEIRYRVREQYNKDGTLDIPPGLSVEETRIFANEATKIELQELLNVR